MRQLLFKTRVVFSPRGFAQKCINGAFESGERLAKAVEHHPKERVRSRTDGAPINLSNALLGGSAVKPNVRL